MKMKKVNKTSHLDLALVQLIMHTWIWLWCSSTTMTRLIPAHSSICVDDNDDDGDGHDTVHDDGDPHTRPSVVPQGGSFVVVVVAIITIISTIQHLGHNPRCDR